MRATGGGMGAETRHADAPTRDAARDAARDDADAKTTRRAAMPPKKTFTVATKEDLEPVSYTHLTLPTKA